MKVKIIGAGSIGNHLAHASRSLGWQVDICDIDSRALVRTKEMIYPSRYGAWDNNIRLFTMDEVPENEYDLICIGTPPDHHFSIANIIIKESPKAILVEKPLCDPRSTGSDEIFAALKKYGVKGFVGYDHAVGEAVSFCEDLINNEDFGDLLTIDAETREHWGGIFAAHPWLEGPADSYLGYTERGGGALCEHSHALNLWQHFAKKCGAGSIAKVACTINYVENDTLKYDQLSALTLTTTNGTIGRCIQDVITIPSRKYLRLQFEHGFIEVQIGKNENNDLVSWKLGGGEESKHWVVKKRPDDFIRELKHIETSLVGNAYDLSPIKIEKGFETMAVINAALASHENGQTLEVTYPVRALKS